MPCYGEENFKLFCENYQTQKDYKTATQTQLFGVLATSDKKELCGNTPGSASGPCLVTVSQQGVEAALSRGLELKSQTPAGFGSKRQWVQEECMGMTLMTGEGGQLEESVYLKECLAPERHEVQTQLRDIIRNFGQSLTVFISQLASLFGGDIFFQLNREGPELGFKASFHAHEATVCHVNSRKIV